MEFNKETKDKFDLQLQDNIKIIKECQNKQAVDSCSKCYKFLDCQTRDDYVQSVYLSMNKGKGGGFEF
jgi:hypothetical protein